MTEQCLIMKGNLNDGYKPIGPFPNSDAAFDYDDRYLGGGNWLMTLSPPQVQYNDTFDPDQQITLEEEIADVLFQFTHTNLSEEDASLLGKDILRIVIAELRPDLVAPRNSTVDHCTVSGQASDSTGVLLGR